MLNSLVLSLLWSAGNPRIDFIAPLRLAAEELEAAYGIKLDTPSDLSGQVVYVRAREPKPERVLNMLAQSLDCKVEHKGGRWQLVRDSRLLAERRWEEAAERKRVLLPQFEKFLEKAAQPYKAALDELIQKGPQASLGRGHEPGERALAKLLADLGPDRLAELDLSSHRIYSFPPGRGDLPLPGMAASRLTELNRENGQLSLVLGQFPKPSGPYATPFSSVKLEDRQKPAALISVVLSRHRNLLQTVAYAYSADGSLVSTGSAVFEDSGTASPDHLGSDSPIDIPARANELLTFEEGGEAPSEAGVALWKEMQEEPLRFLISPLLNQLAEINKCDIAAAVPDSVHSRAATGKPKTEAELLRLLASGGMSLIKRDGWLTSRLTRQSWLGKTNLDRESLRRYSKSWKATGLPLLKARARFAFENGDSGWLSDLGTWLNQNVVSPIRGSYLFPPMASGGLMQTLGSLNEGGWDSLIEGRPVEIGVSTQLATLLLRDTFGPNQLEPFGLLNSTDMDRNGATAFRFGRSSVITLKSANGLVEAIRGPWSEGFVTPIPRAASTIAASLDRPDEAQVASLLSDPTEWGHRGELNLEVWHGPNHRARASLDLQDFVPEGAALPFASWPKERRERFLDLVRTEHAKKEKGAQAPPP